MNRVARSFSFCTQILRKPDGSSRGFGFVTYSDDMSVEQVLQLAHEINGTAVCPQGSLQQLDSVHSMPCHEQHIGVQSTGCCVCCSAMVTGYYVQPSHFCSVPEPSAGAS